MELLRAGTIARLVYDSRYGPVALPFEYQMHQGSIVFRTYAGVDLKPWIEGEPEHFIRVTPSRIAGQRLRLA